MKILSFLLVAASLGSSAWAQGTYVPPAGTGTMMGAPMPTMAPAPPPTTAPPTYPSYPTMSSQAPAYPGTGYDPNYGAPAYSAPPQGMQYGAPSGTYYGNWASNQMLTYNYLVGEYRFMDPKNNGLDGASGIGLALSAQLFQPLFIKAQFSWGSSSGKRSYDFSSVSMGAGLYLPISQRFHFLGEIGGVYTKLDATQSRFSLSDGAIYVRPAIRWQALNRLELQAGVTVTSADDFNNRVLDVNAYLALFEQFDLGLGADFGDEMNSFHGGVRFRW
ncbi:MAG: hypothetical protein KDK99_20875 [Verrucomicrobiales bacterium]|nr:hypothetical protein [Verrucomicrobiales bacterium]